MGGVRVLELRIHGIANATPADMLCTVGEQVEKTEGDDQGSFWRIKPRAPERRFPWSARLHIEAYSWGNQARSGGGAALAPAIRAVQHVFWLFVLPFGLCNLAYWARRDIKGGEESRTWWAGGDGGIAIRVFALLQTLIYVVGFMTVFVHLIGLQCFRPAGAPGGARACAALPDWLDFLVEWSPVARGALSSLGVVAVIALISLVSRRPRRLFNPERSFDDEAAPRPAKRARKRSRSVPDVAVPRPPLLASPGFWQRSRVAQTSERAHLAATFAAVLLLLAGDALLDARATSAPIDVLTTAGAATGASAFAGTMTVIGALLLTCACIVVVIAGLSAKVIPVRVLRGWSTAVLLVSMTAYLVWIGTALIAYRETSSAMGGDTTLRGLIVGPTLIAALGALVAVGSLAWGLGWRRQIVRALLPLAFASVCVSELWARSIEPQSPEWRFWLSAGAVAAVAVAVAVAYLPSKRPEVQRAARHAAWHGNGAAVVLLISLLTSLVMTTLLVVGVHAWLAARRSSAQLSGAWRTLEAKPAASDCADSEATGECVITAPVFYERFSVLVVVVLLVTIAVAMAAALVVGVRPVPAYSLPKLRFPATATARQMERDASLGGTAALTTDPRHVAGPHRERPHAPHVVLREDYPPIEEKPSARRLTVAHERRAAGLLHRGEAVLRVLAIATAVALVPLTVPFWGELLSADNDENLLIERIGSGHAALWAAAADVAVWALGLLALAAVAWVVTNAVTAKERPLGLVWDIISFFPMAGHPFGPPCYGERVVPELRKRIREWLQHEGRDARVILTAHSMGAVLAVAAIFAIHGASEEAKAAKDRGARHDPSEIDLAERIALLTYGAQLRAFFSRFFPQVFGPGVLGIRGTAGPALFGGDPWRRQVLDDFDDPVAEPAARDQRTLVEILGGDLHDRHGTPPRWRSLWRRTDPLGFPVDSYWSDTASGVDWNPIDRGATERSPTTYLWSVAGHSDYLSTLQYRAARDEVIAMLRR